MANTAKNIIDMAPYAAKRRVDEMAKQFAAEMVAMRSEDDRRAQKMREIMEFRRQTAELRRRAEMLAVTWGEWGYVIRQFDHAAQSLRDSMAEHQGDEA